ncbi:MAG: hypothetical protein OHK0046_38390 [Anaerolineae bacterium]
MDEDRAGQGATIQISKLSHATKYVPVSFGKDLNDFYLLSGYHTVRTWVNELIE